MGQETENQRRPRRRRIGNEVSLSNGPLASSASRPAAGGEAEAARERKKHRFYTKPMRGGKKIMVIGYRKKSEDAMISPIDSNLLEERNLCPFITKKA